MFRCVEPQRAALIRAALDYSSPIIPKKKDTLMGILLFWCERWDSNPHGETTRTSNVLVYHSNTLANDYCIITSKR